MMCKDTNVKDLLPDYRRRELDPQEQDRVKRHLEECDDCRAELALLRTMAEETVPDPGEAFWADMPDRVFRAVQRQKEKKWHFSLSWLTDRLVPPRWALAAAAVGLVLSVSLLVGRSLQKSPVGEVPQGGESVDEILVTDSGGAMSFNDLDRDQLETVSDWAGQELASIAEEAEPVMVNNPDADIYEELASLNSSEAEHLSTLLDQWKQEGS